MYYDTSGELYMLWKVAQVFARGVGLLFCSHHLSLGRKADKYVHTLQFFFICATTCGIASLSYRAIVHYLHHPVHAGYLHAVIMPISDLCVYMH